MNSTIEIPRPEIRVNLSAVPESMRSFDQWVLWKYKWVDPRPGQPTGKWTKLPIRWIETNNGGVHLPASSTNPATWMTFRAAAKFIRMMQTAGKCSVGLGFVFTADSPFFGVDLDKCRDPQTGILTAEASAIVADFASYTEISPSGTGVKIFTIGDPPGDECRRGNVEHYRTGRFFTVTGDRLGDVVDPQPRQEVIERFYFATHPDDTPTAREQRQRDRAAAAARIAHNPTLDLSDQAVVDKASSARNGESFRRLWSGDWTAHTSPSEAIFALLSRLAFYVGNDAGRLLRLLNQSGFTGLAKWTEMRGRMTYPEYTVDRFLQRGGTSRQYGDGSYDHDDPDACGDQISPEAWAAMWPESNATIAAPTIATVRVATARVPAPFDLEAAGLTSPRPAPLPTDTDNDQPIDQECLVDIRDARIEKRQWLKCPRGVPQFMASTTKWTAGIRDTNCGCYSCHVCAPLNKANWMGHFAKILPANLFASLLAVDDKRLKEIKKNLSDNHVNFLSIKTSDNQTLIVATDKIIDDWPCAEVTKAEAIDMIDTRLDHIILWGPPHKDPVSTTKPWNRSKPDSTGWVSIGSLPQRSESEIRSHIETMGSSTTAGRMGGANAIFFTIEFPGIDRVADQERADYRLRMFKQFHEKLVYRLNNSIDGFCLDEFETLSPEAERLITGTLGMCSTA